MKKNEEKEYDNCLDYPEYSDIPDIKEDGSENIRYDNPDFPVFCRRNFIPAGVILIGMSVHWHSDIEFVYIKKGSAFYQLNGETVKMNAGEGIFVNSRQLHVIVPGDENCELDCVIFSPIILCASKDIAENFVTPLISAEAAPYLLLHETVPWERKLLKNLSLLYELSLKENSKLKMMERIYRIWELLYENLPRKANADKKGKTKNEGFECIKRMIAYIQENYRENITLDSVCRAGGVGRTACTKLFSKYVNSTPIDYLRHYRISKSIELLTATDLTVTQIAYETGFSGASFFAKTFRKVTGITPCQLRSGFSEGKTNE